MGAPAGHRRYRRAAGWALHLATPHRRGDGVDNPEPGHPCDKLLHRLPERIGRRRADAKATGIKFDRKPTLTPAPAKGGPQAPRSGGDAVQRRSQLQ
jgi:hypothetical protein